MKKQNNAIPRCTWLCAWDWAAALRSDGPAAGAGTLTDWLTTRVGAVTGICMGICADWVRMREAGT
jgi:hypothetical protein